MDVDKLAIVSYLLSWNGYLKEAVLLSSTNRICWADERVCEGELTRLRINLKQQTCLMLSASVGNINRLKNLISGGADVNNRDSTGWTSLHYAARGGYLDCVKELIMNGADVNAFTDHVNMTPLIIATKRGHTDIVRELCMNSANVNAEAFNSTNALTEACKIGNLPIVRELISWGTDVNFAWERGITNLMWAAQGNYIEILKILCDAGASIDMRNNFGWSALFEAVHNKSAACVLELLSRGADISITDSLERTVLDIHTSPEISAMLAKKLKLAAKL